MASKKSAAPARDRGGAVSRFGGNRNGGAQENSPRREAAQSGNWRPVGEILVPPLRRLRPAGRPELMREVEVIAAQRAGLW